MGGRDVGEMLVDDSRVAVVSATGSTAMGRAVGRASRPDSAAASSSSAATMPPS